MTDVMTNLSGARDVFERYEEVYERGHDDYMRHARMLEDFYLGAGRQWADVDRAYLESMGRPCYEIDIIKPAVNAAVGYQIGNRVDISFVPRGGAADEVSAKLMSKTIRQILDNAQWRHKETQVFMDGMIQQRGFFDMRMSYDGSDVGDIVLRTPDPMDCLPDPDARSDDPDEWADYRETRWLTQHEIESAYGKEAADEVVARASNYCDENAFGEDRGIARAGFNERLSTAYSLNRAWKGSSGYWRRYRVIEQQTNVYENVLVVKYPSGDIKVAEGLTRDQIGWFISQGMPVFKRRMRRVNFKVAAPEVMLFDQISPYDHMTVIPYFPYFRRGRSVGMVDAMISPQQALNKFVSQYAHVVNTSANSGWQGEANSLDNMTDDELQDKGGETGLLLLRRPGTAPFEKIQPNQIPTGIDNMIKMSHDHARLVSGMDATMMGDQKGDMSGVAVQSLQYASQQKLALPLDSLSKCRKLVAGRALELVQKFYGAERVMRITEEDVYGTTRHVPTIMNQRMPDGSILNDLTAGTYDLIVAEQPAQITFDNSQFEQMKSMRVEMGIDISDARVIRASNLADKNEIADEMAKKAGQPDPVVEAEIALKKAQASKAEADAVNKRVEGMFSAVKTAREIVLTPKTASLADVLLRSAGFIDQDAAPLMPEAPAAVPGEVIPGAENTHPMFPANPAAGLDQGLNATT